MSDALDGQVCEVIASVLNIPAAGLNGRSRPSDPASWDSLGHLNIVLSLEQEFDVSFGPEDAEAMSDIDAIVALLRKRLAEKR